MDLDLITIAKRGSLGSVLTNTHNITMQRLSKQKCFVSKVENMIEFDIGEKEQNRVTAIVSAISFFENYLNDILSNTLISFPKKFGKKQFEIEELKEEGSLLALFEKKANQTILELSYGRFQSYIEKFSKYLDISDSVSSKSISDVNEIKATRDAYIHNDGKADSKYFQKSGEKARVRNENDKLPVDINYVLSAIDSIIDFLNYIFEKIPVNYRNCSYRRVFKIMWENTCLNSRVKFEEAWDIIDEENFFIKDLETDYGFSDSEVEIYNMFKDIYSGTKKTDFGYLFKRWGAKTREHQIALSWLNYPFWL